MSSPERPPASRPSAATPLKGFRAIPGMTSAAIVFVLIVLLGGGGIAVAAWNQSATATIAITAGAAPTTAPAPTPAPTPSPTPTATPTPGPSAGSVVAAPVIATRPAALSYRAIDCSYTKSQNELGGAKSVGAKFSWPVVGNASSYAVSLSYDESGYTYLKTQTVTGPQAIFTVERTQPAYGRYILRVQPMNGGAAGDPVYLTFSHTANLNATCYYASPEGRSPLGGFTVDAAPVAAPPNDNIMRLTWTAAAGASSYVVSVKARNSSYGAEFGTTALNAALTFPPRVRDRWGNANPTGPAYGDYTLRITPMNGGTAGDPVDMVIRYYSNYFSLGAF